jgi:hypothetical protein
MTSPRKKTKKMKNNKKNKNKNIKTRQKSRKIIIGGSSYWERLVEFFLSLFRSKGVSNATAEHDAKISANDLIHPEQMKFLSNLLSEKTDIPEFESFIEHAKIENPDDVDPKIKMFMTDNKDRLKVLLSDSLISKFPMAEQFLNSLNDSMETNYKKMPSDTKQLIREYCKSETFIGKRDTLINIRNITKFLSFVVENKNEILKNTTMKRKFVEFMNEETRFNDSLYPSFEGDLAEQQALLNKRKALSEQQKRYSFSKMKELIFIMFDIPNLPEIKDRVEEFKELLPLFKDMIDAKMLWNAI